MPYQQRIVATGSSFAQEQNGVFTLVDCDGNGTLDLCYIKTRNCGSGTIEVHWTPGESLFQQPYRSTGTVYNVADGLNGTFLMRDWTGDGKADLVFIKTRNTGTGKVEVHVATGESNFQQWAWHSGSCFAPEDNGFWFLSDKNDLVYIKTRNTGTNKIEYHVASRSSNYQSFTVHEGTDFAIEDNGTWCLAPKSSGAWPDLYYIKTRNAGTNTVEVHAVSASSMWKSRTIDVGTGFAQEENGQWMMSSWTHQSQPDLVYIKTRNTGTSKIEVHINPYEPRTPASYVQSSRNVRLEGTTLYADLQRYDGSWRQASVDLNLFLGNIEGKFTWNKKAFGQTARGIQLSGSVLKAELRQTNGNWPSDSFDLKDRLFNNDGTFQAIDVPVVIAIPKEQEGRLLSQLDSVMDQPNFKLYARDEPDGSTTFYANAGVQSEGTYFRTYNAEAKASVLHLTQQKGKAIEQVNVDVFTIGANATATSLGGIGVYAGVDAGISLFKAQASIFDLNLGVGVETGAGLKDGSLDVHAVGCGFQIGRKVSISVFGASFGIDFGRLFD